MAGTSARTYYAAFAALLVLLVLTVAAAQFQLGVLAAPVAFTIAMVKAVIIAAFFMHLKGGQRLTQLVAAGSLLWLVLLVGLTITDYVTRNW